MSDTSRKVFPVESVLALVVGKEDVDIKEIAGFVAGRSIECDCCAKAVSPFAAAWLARWFPKFMDLDWAEGQSGDGFVSAAAACWATMFPLPACGFAAPRLWWTRP